MKICTKCNKELELAEYSVYQSKSRGLRIRSACKLCEYARGQAYNLSHRESKRATYKKIRDRKLATGGDEALRFFFASRMSGYQRTAVQKSIAYTIVADDLVSLYHQQQGLCYYTGKQMVYNHGKGIQQADSMSLDRLNPLQGYVLENVVLCCNFVNTAKGNLTEQEFYDLCSEILAVRSIR
jgi:hypothetical protein